MEITASPASGQLSPNRIEPSTVTRSTLGEDTHDRLSTRVDNELSNQKGGIVPTLAFK